MELYLRWLDNETGGGEPPLGITLCGATGEEQVELLQLGATCLTAWPPKAVLQQRLRDAAELARSELTADRRE